MAAAVPAMLAQLLPQGELLGSFKAYQLSAQGAEDLLPLDPSSRKVDLLQDQNGIVYQKGINCIEVSTPAQLADLYHRASCARHSDATAKNAESSRTHAFYTLALPSGGTFTLVDLAGSEGQRDSMLHSGQQVADSVFINASLGVLKECIRVLSLQARGEEAPRRIPYRDSPLTRCLQRALEGSSAASSAQHVRTLILACVSPSSNDTEQTCSTLRNACFMAGHSSDNHSWTRGAKLGVRMQATTLPAHVAKAVRAHGELTSPYTWSHQQLRTWLADVDGGRYQRYEGNLASVVDGKQLKKWPLLRYKQLCGGDEDQGKKLQLLV